MRFRSLVLASAGIGALTLGGLLASGLAQNPPQDRKAAFAGFPDLVAGLKAIPGCLGVEAVETRSGKNVIFAWFEDKKAVLKWYSSELHQQAMKTFFPGGKFGKPLEDVPDDVGPVLAIAALTIAEKPRIEDSPMPISQISIELYKPIGGGLFLGGRFAPASVKVPRMRDYTPPKKD